MKKMITGISLLLGIFFFTSCSTTMPLQATNNAVGGKKGESSNSCLFASPPYQGVFGKMTSSGICFNSKYGIHEAAKNGKISKVGSVDLKTTNFILFTKYTLIVTGE